MIELQLRNQKIIAKPFIPNNRHLETIQGKLTRLIMGLDVKEQLRVYKWINELSAGRYYDIFSIAREIGETPDRVSAVWRTLIITGVLKRVEFTQMKPCLVHESELLLATRVIEDFYEFGRGWNSTFRMIKEALLRTSEVNEGTKGEADEACTSDNTSDNTSDKLTNGVPAIESMIDDDMIEVDEDLSNDNVVSNNAVVTNVR